MARPPSALTSWAVLQHVAFEGPGLIAEEAWRRGIDLDVRRTDRGEALPDLDQIGGLVVMGGPMAAYELEAHPYLRGELDLLRTALDRGLPVLGVCLGAQLLAVAAGGSVMPGGVEEIGLGEVGLTEEGHRDPVLGGVGSPLPVLHWHSDTFRPPPGAPLLAESSVYPAQALRVGRRAYGLQFHLELDRRLADALNLHLPSFVEIDEPGRLRVERAGRAFLEAFFDVALEF